MFPDQAHEWKMRRMVPQSTELDADVGHVEKSITAAEKITGGKMADPADFKEEKPKEILPWVPPPEEEEAPKAKKATKKMLAQYPGVTMISSAAQL
jgi:hypothetical protein